MTLLRRLLGALSAALFVAGAIGWAVHQPTRRAGVVAKRPPPTTTPPTTVHHSAPPTSVRPSTSSSGAPGPGSASLQAGLIVPEDMGGYYQVSSSTADTFLDSAPCLASLQPSPAQDGRAATALLNLEDADSVPVIVEEVASYPGSGSSGVYRAVTSGLASCPEFGFSFQGATVDARLAPSSIPPVGDADRVWTAPFSSAGANYDLQIGVVLDAQQVLVVVWIDSATGSNPIMGSFVSTISLAIGELA